MRENAADQTYRDEIIAAWSQEGRLAAESSEAVAAGIELLFGAGATIRPSNCTDGRACSTPCGPRPS